MGNYFRVERLLQCNRSWSAPNGQISAYSSILAGRINRATSLATSWNVTETSRPFIMPVGEKVVWWCCPWSAVNIYLGLFHGFDSTDRWVLLSNTHRRGTMSDVDSKRRISVVLWSQDLRLTREWDECIEVVLAASLQTFLIFKYFICRKVPVEPAETSINNLIWSWICLWESIGYENRSIEIQVMWMVQALLVRRDARGDERPFEHSGSWWKVLS